MARARVSLCMIVRDEARMIDACLASVRGFASEMIVVDTGSKDDTRERARRAGAKVVEIVWQDDFSHARNISLSHAKGDWVLILDADERLVRTDFVRLQKLLAVATFDCGMLRLHDAVTVAAKEADVVSGSARMGDSHRIPRLVRRRPGIEYVGVIHESLGPWLAKSGGKISAVDADIVHYGATREIYDGRGKFARNTRLLIDLAAKTPRDPTALGYLAAQYIENNELAKAHEAAEEGWRRLRYVETGAAYKPSILRLADVRAMVQLWMGDLRGVLETVQRAQRYEGAHYDLDHLAGYALELLSLGARDATARARFRESARGCFERCIASAGIIHWHAFVVGAAGWSAWTRLGTLNLLGGDFHEARSEFKRALELRPDAPEARLGLLDATLHIDGGKAALAMVSELMSDPALRATPDLWVLAATACEAMGAVDDMARFLAQARAQKSEYVARFRRTRHAECVAAMALYRGVPVAGPGLVGALGALAARAPVAPSDVGAWASELEIVRRVVGNVVRAGHHALLEPLFEPRADVLVPGVTAHVRQVVSELGLDLVYEPPPAQIVVRGDDAVRVRALLRAHPRLEGRVLGADRAPGPEGARAVHAGAGAAGGAPAGVVRVTWQALLEDPVEQCDRLLAALGEGDARPLVRHVVEAYCPPASPDLARRSA